MKFYRIERDIDSLKVFRFDSDNGSLQIVPARFINNVADLADEDIIELLTELGLIEHGVRIVINKRVNNSYSAPFKLFIDITDRCQLNCSHCLTKQLNRGWELSLDDIEAMSNECWNLGIFYIKLGGGEPILHPDFGQILRIFRKSGQFISISTNGIAVNDHICSTIADNRVKTSISIEGPESIDSLIRSKGHFSIALKALHLLQHYGVSTCLRVTLTKHLMDLELIKSLIDIATTHSTKLKLSYCRPAGSARDNNMLITMEYQNIYYDIIRYINQPCFKDIIIMDEGMMLKQPADLESFLYHGRMCGCLNRTMHIDAGGYLSPCVFLDKRYHSGIKYQNGYIEQYWAGQIDSKVNAIRSLEVPFECSNCSRICRYECLATRLYSSGSTYGHDPNCLKSLVEGCR